MTVGESPLELALRLIERGQYQEARQILERMRGSPAAMRWLDYLDSFAPVTPAAPVTDIKRATDEFEIQQIRHELGGTNVRLSHLNEAIQQAQRRQRPNDMLLAVGIATAPLFGIGLVVIAYAMLEPRRHRNQLNNLMRKRRHLLDDMENKYRMLARAKGVTQ